MSHSLVATIAVIGLFIATLSSAAPKESPEDATVLFGDASENIFLSKDGKACPWPVRDGVLISTRGEKRSNHIVSQLHFRDAEIHVEFRLPEKGAGNSGIYIHGHYELQILAPKKSQKIDNKVHGAVYGISKPLVYVDLQRSQWHCYDIHYRAPRRDERGKIVEPGVISAWLDGQLVQSKAKLQEPVSKYHPFRYNAATYLRKVQEKLLSTGVGPVFLQDHDSPVAFRNVWVRPLDDKAHWYQAE